MAADYYFAGMIAGISLLQNGQIPRYFSEELINQIFVSDEPCTSLCILEFRRGLDRLGIHAFTQHVHQFVSIFRPVHNKITVRNFIQLLQPQFSEEGSNKFLFEKIVYNKFIKYVREVAAGRRVTTLEDILVFITCTDEIPVLGFTKQPQIFFPEAILPRSATEIAEVRSDDS